MNTASYFLLQFSYPDYFIMHKNSGSLLLIKEKAGNFFLSCGIAFLFASCGTQKQLAREVKADILDDSVLEHAQVGLTIFDVAAEKYLYNYQGNKYFIPASNTKLFSLYAGLKYLGDSLAGLRYLETDTAIYLFPCGDPSFLHPDYSKQPVIDFLRSAKKPMYITSAGWQEDAWGVGWSWDDYNEDYMPERSPLPVYGNLIKWTEEFQKSEKNDQPFDASPVLYSTPEVNWKVQFTTDNTQKKFSVKRHLGENIFEVTEGKELHKDLYVPFVTNGLESALELLKDTCGKTIILSKKFNALKLPEAGKGKLRTILIRSQPVDSLFKTMMYRSDNFFAEQTLLMVSNEKLGYMSDQKIIDTILQTDLKELPQLPAWVDGSGLSRFNLFTPEDFTWLLNKMKNEFGMQKMMTLLPTNGMGTLSAFSKNQSGHIYAKTGSLTGVSTLSGYLITNKNRLLIFSFLVNNHRGSGRQIRAAAEKLLNKLILTY